MKIMALNTAGYKGIPKEVPHSFETTTVDGLRTELYAAWHARHRESNHFIKMIGRIVRNLVPEISPPIGLD